MRYVLSLCRLIKIQPTNKDKIKSIFVIPIAKTSNWIKIRPIIFFLWIEMAAWKENKNMVLSLKPYRFQMCSTESRENERNVLKRFFFFLGGRCVQLLAHWAIEQKWKNLLRRNQNLGLHIRKWTEEAAQPAKVSCLSMLTLKQPERKVNKDQI